MKLLNEKGFSLVELLVAIVLLTVGMLAAAAMQSTAINSNSFANKLSVANSVAHGVMEEIQSKESNDPFFGLLSGPQYVTGTPVPPYVCVASTYNCAAAVDYDLDPSGPLMSLDVRGAGAFTAKYSITRNQPVQGVSTIVVIATSGNRTVKLMSYKRTIQ